MTRRTFVTTAMLAVAASAVAAAADVSYDMDRSLPFARYRTYAWTPGTRIGDPLNDGRIVAAVDHELAAKGLARGGPDAAPDLRVTDTPDKRERTIGKTVARLLKSVPAVR